MQESYSNTGLAAATGYAYRVSAIAPWRSTGKRGRSYGDDFCRHRMLRLASRRPPFQQRQINLSWTDAATNETGYQIERRLTAANGVGLTGDYWPPERLRYSRHDGAGGGDRVYLPW
jgi:hypothetical protein